MDKLFVCTNLSKNYRATKALENLNLEIGQGRIVGLLGPNGSGKTTLIKLAAGLLMPTDGEILINGEKPGVKTKSIISYLPERTYLPSDIKVSESFSFFEDFYTDFDKVKAGEMLSSLKISENMRLSAMSKGTKEKLQLILVMARRAQLYLLDEPIGGVDPAARDFILNTILNNYAENASIIISTHLINDVEKILDDVVFINNGQVALHKSVDEIREKEGKSIDELFREVYKC